MTTGESNFSETVKSFNLSNIDAGRKIGKTCFLPPEIVSTIFDYIPSTLGEHMEDCLNWREYDEVIKLFEKNQQILVERLFYNLHRLPVAYIKKYFQIRKCGYILLSNILEYIKKCNSEQAIELVIGVSSDFASFESICECVVAVLQKDDGSAAGNKLFNHFGFSYDDMKMDKLIQVVVRSDLNIVELPFFPLITDDCIMTAFNEFLRNTLFVECTKLRKTFAFLNEKDIRAHHHLHDETITSYAGYESKKKYSIVYVYEFERYRDDFEHE